MVSASQIGLSHDDIREEDSLSNVTSTTRRHMVHARHSLKLEQRPRVRHSKNDKNDGTLCLDVLLNSSGNWCRRTTSNTVTLTFLIVILAYASLTNLMSLNVPHLYIFFMYCVRCLYM